MYTYSSCTKVHASQQLSCTQDKTPIPVAVTVDGRAMADELKPENGYKCDLQVRSRRYCSFISSRPNLMC